MFIRSVYRHKACIFLAIASWLFTCFLAPGERLVDMSLLQRLIYNGIGAASYYFIGYWGLGYMLRFSIVRNVPFVWVTIAFFSMLAVAEAAIYSTNITPNITFSGIWKYFLTTIIMVVIAASLVTHYFTNALLSGLSKKGHPFPIWYPTKPPDCELSALVPENIRTSIQRVEAQNQYVKVFTKTGDTLLRMSLSQAETMLPDGIGLRLHRSLWMRKSEIRKIISRDGNPKVVDRSGQEFPISRQKVIEVRAVLNGMD